MEKLQKHGYHRNQNDDQRREAQVITNNGYVAKEIAGDRENSHPQDASDHVIEEKVGVLHGADTGHEGGKGTDDRDKARKDDGFATMFRIETLRAFQIFALEQR